MERLNLLDLRIFDRKAYANIQDRVLRRIQWYSILEHTEHDMFFHEPTFIATIKEVMMFLEDLKENK